MLSVRMRIFIFLFYILMISPEVRSQYASPPVPRPPQHQVNGDHPDREHDPNKRHKPPSPPRQENQRIPRPFDTYDSLAKQLSNEGLEENIPFAQKELNMAMESGDPYKMCYSYYRLGRVYQASIMPHLAMEQFTVALELAKKHNYLLLQTQTTQRMFKIILEQNLETDLAIELIDDLEQLIDNEDDKGIDTRKKGLIQAFRLDIAEVYKLKGDTVEFQKQLQHVSNYLNQDPIPHDRGFRIFKVKYFEVKGKYHEAIKILAPWVNGMRDRHEHANTAFHRFSKKLCTLYLRVGLTDSVSSFVPIFTDIINRSDKNNISEYTDIANILARYYRAKGEVDKTLFFMDLEREMLKDLVENSRIRTSQEYTIKYKTEKKEATIKLQAMTNARQQKEITFLFLAITLISVLSIWLVKNYLEKRKSNIILQQKNAEISHQSQQLKDLSAFKESLSGMIVHDLKNPLNAVIGLSDHAIISESNVKSINKSGRRMLGMVLNILDVQKFEEAEMKLELRQTQLLSIINQARDNVYHLTDDKNISFVINTDYDFQINIDEDIILRVLVNILSNAVKYSGSNSTVTITIKKEKKQEILISIKDEGQGIPQDQLPHIFEKFWQHRSKKSGGVRSVGLGLTFCKLAIESHGGKIDAHSEENVGTEIYFTLPYERDLSHEGRIMNPMPTEISKVGKERKMSSKQLKYLSPFKKKLSQYQIKEVMDILNILDTIDTSDPIIRQWKEETENAMMVGNQNLYHKNIAIEVTT